MLQGVSGLVFGAFGIERRGIEGLYTGFTAVAEACEGCWVELQWFGLDDTISMRPCKGLIFPVSSVCAVHVKPAQGTPSLLLSLAAPLAVALCLCYQRLQTRGEGADCLPQWVSLDCLRRDPGHTERLLGIWDTVRGRRDVE